jgi:4-hydroxybenzoate polyprenyltransferase
VDLDETLVCTNTLVESLLALLRVRPQLLFAVPLWLTRGHAYCWERVVSHGLPQVELLPYRDSVVAFLRAERNRGRSIVLVTGAHTTFAQRIAAHLGVFTGVIGTEGSDHLVREKKAARLVERFGERGYDYVGATQDDLEPCCSAREAFLAASDPKLSRRIESSGAKVTSLSGDRLAQGWFSALRPHQWVKNLLVFAPVLLSHRWSQEDLLARAATLFVAFSLLCSAVYVMNDLFDLESDRRHRVKRHRPLASGQISLASGVALAIACLIASAALTWLLGSAATAGVLGAYAAIALAYSIRLKRLLMIDVAVLAGLYCIRVYAGGVATGIVVSPWTFAFSLFGFTSLALMKRYSEVRALRESAAEGVPGRAYRADDLSMIGAIGVGSSLVAVLVVALYITDPAMNRLYSHPPWLGLLCPIVLIAFARLWILAGRGEMNEDPVLFAIRDRHSIVLLLAMAVVTLLAR